MTFDFQKNMRILEDCIASLDPTAYASLYRDCLEALKNGNKIILSGLGKNVPVCEKIVGSLRSAGLNAAFLHTSTAFHGELGMVREGDVVILLSKSGTTGETLRLADCLNGIGGTVRWAFTFNGTDGLCRKFDRSVILRLEEEGGPWDILPMNSVTASLIVLQGLAIDLIKGMSVPLDDIKRNHPGGGIGIKLNRLQ